MPIHHLPERLLVLETAETLVLAPEVAPGGPCTGHGARADACAGVGAEVRFGVCVGQPQGAFAWLLNVELHHQPPAPDHSQLISLVPHHLHLCLLEPVRHVGEVDGPSIVEYHHDPVPLVLLGDCMARAAEESE